MQLPELVHAASLAADVQGRPLVGVLSVAQRLLALEGEANHLGQVVALLREELRDRRVVGGRVAEDLGRELEPELVSDLVLLQQLEHPVVVARVYHGEHVGVVLRGGAEHRRPSDVDLLDRLLQLHVPLAGRLAERIEVHRHEVDRADAVRLQLIHVLAEIAAG